MAQMTPGVIRAQVTFQGKSNTPKDRYVNTWHFIRREGPIPGVDQGLFEDMGGFRDQIGERLREFYVEATDGGHSVGRFLSDYVLRPFTITCYDLGETSTKESPRTPWTTTHALPEPISTAVLPMETAVVLSLVADRNIRRRRGRIYLGPLAINALETGASGIPWVAGTLRTTLVQAAQRLASPGTMDTLVPAIFSPTDNTARRIRGAWVDADFDTQRSRGPVAFTRTTWGTATPQAS